MHTMGKYILLNEPFDCRNEALFMERFAFKWSKYWIIGHLIMFLDNAKQNFVTVGPKLKLQSLFCSLHQTSEPEKHNQAAKEFAKT